jgi:hypothetical protein
MTTIIFAAASCVAAASHVRIEARSRGFTDVVFTVANRQPDPIRHIRMETSQGFLLEPKEMPVINLTPPGWTGTVVRDEPSGRVHIEWEATIDAAVLPAGSRTEFGIRPRERVVQRPGGNTDPSTWLADFDFRSMPFTATAVSGACWSGTTSNPEAYRVSGRYATLSGAGVRLIEKPGENVVLIDVPLRENQARLGKKVYLSVPLAVTFGVTGGFSADMSIGIGLMWAPTQYVSASAKTSFGTFFFNNRTHVRGVGLDFAIPINTVLFAEGLNRHTKYFVIGVEYFRRDVAKWAGFMDGPQWYASGTGVAIRAGIRGLGWSGP